MTAQKLSQKSLIAPRTYRDALTNPEAWKLARLCVEVAHASGQALTVAEDWPETSEWNAKNPENPRTAAIYDTLSLVFACDGVLQDKKALELVFERAQRPDAKARLLALIRGERAHPHDRVDAALAAQAQKFQKNDPRLVTAINKLQRDQNGNLNAMDLVKAVLPKGTPDAEAQQIWMSFRHVEITPKKTAKRPQSDRIEFKPATKIAGDDAQRVASDFKAFTVAKRNEHTKEVRRKSAAYARKEKVKNPPL